jgi:hypothetical protein
MTPEDRIDHKGMAQGPDHLESGLCTRVGDGHARNPGREMALSGRGSRLQKSPAAYDIDFPEEKITRKSGHQEKGKKPEQYDKTGFFQ